MIDKILVWWNEVPNVQPTTNGDWVIKTTIVLLFYFAFRAFIEWLNY